MNKFLLLAGLTLTFLGCPSPSGGNGSLLKGSVSINGTAQVGQPLTADTVNLGGNGIISYQWRRGDTQNGAFTDISGATAETYTPVAADEGKYLRVTVTRSGHTGSITSSAVGAVLAASAPTVTSVTISPKTPTVVRGGTQQFSAAVNGTNNPAQTVTWSVSGASAGTAIVDGLLTVAAHETSSLLIVTVTSTADTSRSDTASVTIIDAFTVTGVTINPSSATVARGGIEIFTAAVMGTGHPPQTVIWNVYGAGAGTTIVDGLLTVAINETAASLTVTAASTADPTKTNAASITISGTVTVTGVTVDPPNATVAKGGTMQFSAAVSGTNHPAQTVTWSVSGGSAGTAIDDGLLTVAAHETAASLTVRATSTINTGVYGTATVTVVEAPAVTGVTVNPPSATVTRGGTQIFIAAVTGTNNPAQTVTWSVSGAGAGTTIIGGLLTVAADETAVSLTVTATSTVDTTKHGTASVTVTHSPLTGAVIISGSARAGSTLTANTGNLFGTGTIGYQWQQGNTATGTFTNISDATAPTYTPVTADVGKFLRVTVTRTGNIGSITSNAAGPVEAAPSQTDPVNGTITVNDGIENVTVSFANAGSLTLNKNGSLIVTVSGSYQAYRWYVNTVLLSDETAASITLNGEDYDLGNHHRILVIVYKNNIPYSQEIRFTVQ